jgi:Protein of unknown function (DUF2934)
VATRKTTKSQIKRSSGPGINGRVKLAPEAPDARRAANLDSPSFEQIQLRAYEIFVARGGAPGNEVSDWLEAEKQLLQGSGPRSN